LWELEDAYLSQNAQLHSGTFQPLHEFEETVSSSSSVVMAWIAVAIAWLKLKVVPTQQKPELASGILHKADPPLSFWVLDAEALGLNSDGCGHVRKMLLANNIIAVFLSAGNC
jgi:hypothetical protein